MPLIQVKLIENVFTTQRKQKMIKKLTDAMVSIEGENMRSITWVIIENVNSGEWRTGGQPLFDGGSETLTDGKS
jgi:4-oxalocrotonate tautomerase